MTRLVSERSGVVQCSAMWTFLFLQGKESWTYYLLLVSFLLQSDKKITKWFWVRIKTFKKGPGVLDGRIFCQNILSNNILMNFYIDLHFLHPFYLFRLSFLFQICLSDELGILLAILAAHGAKYTSHNADIVIYREVEDGGQLILQGSNHFAKWSVVSQHHIVFLNRSIKRKAFSLLTLSLPSS